MVGDGLDVLDTLGILDGEVAVDVAQRLEKAMVKVLQLRQRQFTERDKVFDFYTDAIAYECILGKKLGKRFGLATIAAIYRRDGG